jgi:hypothetical protein
MSKTKVGDYWSYWDWNMLHTNMCKITEVRDHFGPITVQWEDSSSTSSYSRTNFLRIFEYDKKLNTPLWRLLNE